MKNVTVSNQSNEKDALYLLEQAMGYTFQACLRVAALLGVADHLVDKPKTVTELAQELNVVPLELNRIMRMLSSKNVFKYGAGDKCELTPAAEFLRTDHPQSLRSAILMLTDPTFWRPHGELVENVKGNPAFKHLYGMSFFDYWALPDAPKDDFHKGMSSLSEIENTFLLKSYQFPENITVVDVAGGFGGLLLKVLQNNPTLKGILFDRPHVLERNRLSELKDDSRWEIQTGDFFKALPEADIYMIKYIMHDWPDAQAIEILKNCRKAMRPGGKILIMDPIVAEDNIDCSGKAMDIICMAILNGGERTEKQLRDLLAAAGLKVNRIIKNDCYVSITEAVVA